LVLGFGIAALFASVSAGDGRKLNAAALLRS
jgi:hypothetical protein